MSSIDERYSKTRRVRGKTDDGVADTFSTCSLLTAGHKYDSPVLRKVFSSETNAGSDNSARGAVAPPLERRVRCERDRRYAVVSPRRADRQIARTIATRRRRRERLDETSIYLFQR